jgi:hypothetical protein
VKLNDIAAALSDWLVREQQSMTLMERDAEVLLAGEYELRHNRAVIEKFDVRVYFHRGYPCVPPTVFEDGGRIPKTADRHVYVGGSCCVGVWEEWLACSNDLSPESYMDVLLRNYFIAQLEFERTGNWPFGQRSHNLTGLIESFASVLGVQESKSELTSWLTLLSHDWKKGHWLCPCSKHLPLRRCDCGKVEDLSKKVHPVVARMMQEKLSHFGGGDGKKT